MKRKQFLYELGYQCIATIPDVHARLQADPPARIANLACGPGWSSIGLARAYPKVRVDSFDRDEQAIESAWANARNNDLIDRLTFHVRNPGDSLLNGRYDLVIAFAWIPDLDNSVSVLRTMRRLAGETGHVLVLAEDDTVTVKDVLQRYAQEAGFQTVEELPIAQVVDALPYDLFHFYRLYR